MKHLLIISLYLFSINSWAYSSPFAPAQSELRQESEQRVADRASDIARCFNGAIRTGMDYMQVLRDCAAQASNTLTSPEEKTQLADRASDIARCFNGTIRTGMDYMQVLRDCAARASYSPATSSYERYSELEMENGTAVSF